MAIIRNWRDATPYVGHETAIIWPMFRGKGTEGLSAEEAPLQGAVGFTLHRMQAGMSGDYHEHEADEQLYYFTEGGGKIKLDGEIYPVRQGDAVYVPPKMKHQLINDTEDWVEHLIITVPVR